MSSQHPSKAVGKRLPMPWSFVFRTGLAGFFVLSLSVLFAYVLYLAAFERSRLHLFGGISTGVVTTCCVGAIVMSTRWTISTRARRKRIRSLDDVSKPLKFLAPRGRSESILSHDEPRKPGVAFIMPVKWGSIKSASPKENWRSQIVSMYSGFTESIFAVESEDDGAIPLVKELQEEMPNNAIKLVVAGHSKTCSQKIHNMLAGAASCDPRCKYIFFMDANSRLHPGTVQSMVWEMENDRDPFVATGFPFDVPNRNGTWWAWTAAQFRWNCLSEFMSNRSSFVWGGCMMMRKSDFDNNSYNIIDRWRCGGYSDDMQVQAVAMDNNRSIATPMSAVFYNQFKQSFGFRDCWYFLRRQNFVLHTYTSTPDWLRQTTLAILYCTINGTWLPASIIAVSSLGKAALYPSTYLWGAADSYCRLHLAVCIIFLLLFHQAVLRVQDNLSSVARMNEVLAPETGKVDISHITLSSLFVAQLMQSTMAVLVTIVTCCKSSMDWGGVVYTVCRGRISAIQRHGRVTHISEELRGREYM